MLRNKKIARSLWLVCLMTALVVGLALLMLAVLPYSSLKPVADTLARDGTLELFTPQLLSQITPVLLLTVIICLLFAVSLVIWRQPFHAWAERLSIATLRAALAHNYQELASSLQESARQDRIYLYALGLITLLAAVQRGLFLSTPMQHDEAYTYTAFASNSFVKLISDYHLPNNHVFHTVLVFATTNLLGNQPWSVRLPAYLAGVLLVPATYVVGKLLYQRNSGLIASGVVAITPVLVSYSTNARGYTLISLATLLMTASSAYLLKHRNGLIWGVLSITAVLGLYTMPTMLYPLGMVFSWLLLSWIAQDVSPRYAKTFPIYLIISGIATIALTTLLYTPILYKSGLSSLIENQYIRTYTYALLWDNLLVRAASTREQWMQGMPPFVGILSVLGFVVGLVLHSRIARQRIPLQIAAILWIIAMLATQRVAPLSRVWLFLLPLFIIWSLAGITGFVRFFIPRRIERELVGLVLLVAVLISLTGLTSTIVGLHLDPQSIGIEEEITLYLRENLQPGDLVVVKSPMSTPVDYYFRRYNIPLDYLDSEQADITRAFVIVSSRYDQTLESVLDRRDLDPESFTSQPRVVHEYKHTTIYELWR